MSAIQSGTAKCTNASCAGVFRTKRASFHYYAGWDTILVVICNIIKKKMKLISTFIVIVLLSGCQSKEQSVVISQNSISIAMQIYAISSKISLSDESIMNLRTFFQENDSLAEMELKKENH